MVDLGGECNERLPNSQTTATRKGKQQCLSPQYNPVTMETLVVKVWTGNREGDAARIRIS